MNARQFSSHSRSLLHSLADFRFELRSFLCFSEQAASQNGLQPQQHQLLLQVAGAPEAATVTIAYAAARLGLKHNSVVELVDRSEREGLLERVADATDKRRILLRVTRKGSSVLNKLTGEHARELNVMAPRLMAALEHVRAHANDAVDNGSTNARAK
jgi:DNA-binding MarR family transcriptional regulator